MTFRGRVKNGMVVLEAPGQLPEGAEVEVRPLREIQFDAGAKPIWEELQEIMAQVPPHERAQLPTDAAQHHDHYIYGTPKNPT